MKLKKILGLEKENVKQPQHVKNKKAAFDLGDLFREGIDLGEQYSKTLKEDAEKGRAYFLKVNEARISLAFESFDEDMKKALFEILYLLHVNESFLAEHKYVKRVLRGKATYKEEDKEVNLYLADAPSGVLGIDSLSPRFKEDFEDYVFSAFGRSVPTEVSYYELPINGIYSIGSIGTVGHKNIASDLDLEIQYEFEPNVFDTKGWNDSTFLEALKKELAVLVKGYYYKKGFKEGKLESFPKIKEATEFFKKRIQKKYPYLFRHLMEGDKELLEKIHHADSSKPKLRVIHEIMSLMESNFKLNNAKAIKKKEALLKKRVLMIQNYIQDKFPTVEVYLFPFSTRDFRQGHFGSTLESKESSGGAYELILNYETLMPGIYFTPVVPSHFLLPRSVNNREDLYSKITDAIHFNLIPLFKPLKKLFTNQGPTPDLDQVYVAKHYSAVYWEAFKASYGNLPKATLNLLRYESLLEPHLSKSIIQLVKNPKALDHHALSKKNIEKLLNKEKIFSPKALIQFESDYPGLQIDPWWLRYKALKIAFGVPDLVSGVSQEELIQINRTIDLAFALHIRLSDVFDLSKADKKKKIHRQTVLSNFLEVVFPDGTDFKNQLYAIFIGDVESVNFFEIDLRNIFKKSIERIHQKVKQLNVIHNKKQSQETEIWHHYYLKSFMPQPNVVPLSILNHLQIPRGRLKIGYVPEKGWFFKSLQKGSTIGKRFESSILNLLPNQVTLIQNTKFLYGLVYCVVNRYYGIFDKDTLKESRTAIEYDRQFSNIGTDQDNKYAHVRPDQLDHIMEMISESLHPIQLSYLDCIHKEREVVSVMIFFNLLKCGNVSIFYRDNMDTLYVSTCDIPAVEKNAEKLYNNFKLYFGSRIIHKFLTAFFLKQNINPGQVEFEVWVNSNSFQTAHVMSNEQQKAQELSNLMKQVIIGNYNKIVNPDEE